MDLKKMNERLCPCGSGEIFTGCCHPVLTRVIVAPTAEAVMRARYSAFVEGDIDFLHESLKPETRGDFDFALMERWARNSVWEGLDIRETREGGAEDQEGWVEFLARFTMDGKTYTHHETSHFVKEGGVWYYQDGLSGQGTVRKGLKIGRNDPCSCGSGKKYKKCCGT